MVKSENSYYPFYPFGSLQLGRNDNAGDYRFGFNGLEMDNEVSGTGNINTAMFWEYDTRMGRRWNVDPVVKPWESTYACFYNNPISNVDILGDIVKFGKDIKVNIGGNKKLSLGNLMIAKMQNTDKGKKVYNKLNDSKDVFTLNLGANVNGKASNFQMIDKKGDVGYFSMTVDPSSKEYRKLGIDILGAVAKEFSHGYSFLQGDFGYRFRSDINIWETINYDGFDEVFAKRTAISIIGKRHIIKSYNTLYQGTVERIPTQYGFIMGHNNLISSDFLVNGGKTSTGIGIQAAYPLLYAVRDDFRPIINDTYTYYGYPKKK